MATLYFHIPFCKRICSYCDFYRVGALRLLPDVVEQMHCELERRASYLKERRLTSIYFGGGTPSLLAPDVIEDLINRARGLFDCSAVEEITIEANPDDLTDDYVARLSATSVNRVSLGIQSFDDEALRLMNRRHSAEEAETAVRRLQRAGIDNISIDLIFGIAGYGGASLDATLSRALSLGVGHISAYHLTVEPRTRLGLMVERGEYEPVGEELSEREYLAVHNALTAAGYEHYEVSNYALPSCRAKHNSAYWRGVEYLGIGAGAHSFTGDNRMWCTSTAKQYAEGDFRYEEEILGEREHFDEYVMTALRCSEGIDLDAVAERFGSLHAERMLSAARGWIEAGVVLHEGGTLRMPPEKFLLSDAVIESLFM